MLVSVIVPTYNRPALLRVALECVQNQDWPDKELIVVDDGTEPVGGLCAALKGVAGMYVRRTERMVIGAKRNLACEHARGEIIAHFDDDDWSDNGRLTDQVLRLLETGKAVTGYNTLLFWNAAQQKAWRWQAGRDDYAAGATLCYRRSFWERHRFPSDRDRGEDNEFVRMARDAQQLITASAGQRMVARIHGNNTEQNRNPPPPSWPAVDRSEVPGAFFAAIGATA